jgi:2-polyprenyl-3-methyl-5-hydroxy-6-metoxy-1,4-benzoquinol methylase
MSNELGRVETLSSWYLKEQLDFDKRLVRYRYETIRPHLAGPRGLELGPAEGEMTRFLVNDFESLTVVDGASELLAQIPDHKNLTKIHALFEEYEPEVLFNTIVIEHVLEHVEEPVDLLRRVKRWLEPNGRLLLGVPNGNSIHRLVAVKMALLEHSCQLNARDHALGHRRIYTHETLRQEIEQAGIVVEMMGGVYFKPLSNQQIQDNWNEAMIQGFYELGKDFPEHAAEIYAVCKLS